VGNANGNTNSGNYGNSGNGAINGNGIMNGNGNPNGDNRLLKLATPNFSLSSIVLTYNSQKTIQAWDLGVGRVVSGCRNVHASGKLTSMSFAAETAFTNTEMSQMSLGFNATGNASHHQHLFSSSGTDGVACVYDLRTLSKGPVLQFHGLHKHRTHHKNGGNYITSGSFSASFSPCLRYLCCPSEGGNLHLYDIRGISTVGDKTSSGAQNSSQVPATTREGRRLAAQGNAGSTMSTSYRNDIDLDRLHHGQACSSAKFCPRSGGIISCGFDGGVSCFRNMGEIVRKWRRTNKNSLNKWKRPGGGMRNAANTVKINYQELEEDEVNLCRPEWDTAGSVVADSVYEEPAGMEREVVVERTAEAVVMEREVVERDLEY
jgi:hypothetical protein